MPEDLLARLLAERDRDINPIEALVTGFTQGYAQTSAKTADRAFREKQTREAAVTKAIQSAADSGETAFLEAPEIAKLGAQLYGKDAYAQLIQGAKMRGQLKQRVLGSMGVQVPEAAGPAIEGMAGVQAPAGAPPTSAMPQAAPQVAAPPPIAPTAEQRTVGSLVQATHRPSDLPEGVDISVSPIPGVTMRRQATTPTEQTRRLLAEATRTGAPAGAVQAAISQAGLPLTPEVKDYLQGQSLLAYRRHLKAAGVEGLRGPEAERQAARRSFEETGVLHPQIPSERYFASKEEEAHVAENYVVKELAGGRGPQEAFTHASVLGYRVDPAQRKAIMDRVFRTAVVTRQEALQAGGLTEPAAFRQAIQDAAKYTGGEGVPAEGPFAQMLVPEEAPISKDVQAQAYIELGKKPSELTPKIAGEAERIAEDKRVALVSRETRARLLQERGPTGVPERPSAEERRTATAHAEALESGRLIKEALRKNAGLVGGPLGIAGRINRGLVKLDAAPPEFAPFDANLKKLRANMIRAMAGANVGPVEAQEYLGTFPNGDQSTQEFTANLNVTIDNIDRLERIGADIRRRSGIMPLTGEPTTLSPEGRSILDKYRKKQ